MSTLDVAKGNFSAHKTSIEARFAGGDAGHRFWLFLFNILASLFLFVWMAWLSGEVVIVVLAVVFSTGFVAFFEVDDTWRNLTDWRREK